MKWPPLPPCSVESCLVSAERGKLDCFRLFKTLFSSSIGLPSPAAVSSTVQRRSRNHKGTTTLATII